jgi:CRP-like cAMP-binding protein
MQEINTFVEFINNSNSSPIACKKREVVYLFDTYPKGIYLITTGRIKTYRTNQKGKEFITEIYKAGDFFGFPVLLDVHKHLDAAIALEDSKIYFIPKEDFLNLLASNSLIALKLIKLLAEKLNKKEDQLLKLAYNSVKKTCSRCTFNLVT